MIEILVFFLRCTTALQKRFVYEKRGVKREEKYFTVDPQKQRRMGQEIPTRNPQKAAAFWGMMVDQEVGVVYVQYSETLISGLLEIVDHML